MSNNSSTKSVNKRTTELINLLRQTKEHHYPTPYMLTDLATVRRNAQEFKDLLPEAKIYYAVKCFSDVEVIKELDKIIDGYDVASVEEIRKLHSLGVKSSRLIFSNPVKSEQALAAAHRLGIKKFAYQSHNELVKVKKYIKNPQVYLRVKVTDSTSALSFSNKFGCEPSKALDLLLQARRLGLNPVGVTFHVGSQAHVPVVWEGAIKQAAMIIRQAQQAGLNISLLNIGGGYPVRYNKDDPTLAETLSVIKEGLTKNIGQSNMTIIAEPGRYLVADSSVIVASIIGVEERKDKTWLYLDVGAFQAFVEIFEFGYFPYPVYSLDHLQGRLPTKRLKKYVLTGPSCDSYDTMATEVKLPTDLAVGNKLLIDKTGAYTVVYGSDFNGFKVPKRHFIDIERKEQ